MNRPFYLLFQKRGRYPFSGMINDIKHRYPHYLSDFVDGLNGQVLAATIFIYFAALSGAVAFGGLTGNQKKLTAIIDHSFMAPSELQK